MTTSQVHDVIDLRPVSDADGTVVWTTEPSSPPHLAPTDTDLVIDTRQPRSPLHLLQGDHRPQRISSLPEERMAGTPDAWGDIVRNLRAAEEGQANDDVNMRPGGTLEVVKPGDNPRPLSRLPEERMAGVNPAPTVDDAQVVMAIDPTRVERWEPVTTGLLNGWKFRLRPEPRADEFVFLAFRNPSDGNAFRLFVVKPDVDDLFGHRPHMISVPLGGQAIPVLCGPGGRAARTLEEARVFAGKWMLYNYRQSVLGVDPGFSL